MRGIAPMVVLLVGCTAPPADADGDSSEAGDGTASPNGDAASDATAGGSAGDSSGDDATGTGAATDTGPPWDQHEFHTVLTDAGRLALESNLPPSIDDCPAGAPCDDLDADGFNDAWEDVVLDRLRPLRRFDEAEPALTDDAAGLADVGRVFAMGDAFHIYVMLGYASDYGTCGVTAHNGDSERVALRAVAWPEGGPGGIVIDAAYTAAHEGTANDHGQVFVDGELDQLVLGTDPETAEPRWVVFPSAGKHATYATVDICEGISTVPCFDEDCAPDGVDDPAAYDRLPESFNAGEPRAPRLTDLTRVGYPGDDAWADQEFCGGLGPGTCSSAVVEKLTVDPF